uniref:Histone-lysine N-methyltransferase n=1 Tax=Sexangularia sp. CB-2014 TaxID=1486929 RepID=A0A7S1Y9G0_9EUKA|mmetsp:Transcript_11883/g.37772  ORF Transcript_11883/g.37772 Transcript_11883/m.37772 type:complete len:340 (+) Transcript_11883:1-1020(+)
MECTFGKCSAEFCQNSKLQKPGVYALPVEVFDAGGKGLGLRAREPATPGTFINEYRGEVIDADEVHRRLCEDKRHFYILSMPNGMYLDASRRGHYTRFINHSCDPNAVTQIWIVKGVYRVAIYACRHIDVGEEITFDYNLEQVGQKKQRCLCGTPICRGTLGGGKPPKNIDPAALVAHREKARKEAYARYQRDLTTDPPVVPVKARSSSSSSSSSASSSSAAAARARGTPVVKKLCVALKAHSPASPTQASPTKSEQTHRYSPRPAPQLTWEQLYMNVPQGRVRDVIIGRRIFLARNETRERQRKRKRVPLHERIDALWREVGDAPAAGEVCQGDAKQE